MNAKTAVSAEICPSCGSLDVRAVEPHWFAIDINRRGELDPVWVDSIEFGCRDCGSTWD